MLVSQLDKVVGEFLPPLDLASISSIPLFPIPLAIPHHPNDPKAGGVSEVNLSTLVRGCSV